MTSLNAFVILTLWTSGSFASNSAETFSPATVADNYGNSANADSQIAWADLPDWDPYVTDTSYDAKGLGPIYSGAKHFINVVQPNEVPYGECILQRCLFNFTSLFAKKSK